MSEQAARSSARSRATATRAQDRNLRHAASVHPAGQANLASPRERTLRPAPDDSPKSGLRPAPDYTPESDRASPAPVPRRTVVIRGQVADRYTSARHPSPSHRSSGSYGLRLRPERAALWAVLLGLALVIAALASAHM